MSAIPSANLPVSHVPSTLMFVVLTSLLIPMIPLFVWAQSNTASVSGRVTDASGAVLIDAEIEIKNVETNVSERTKTNRDGFYDFAYLKPGHYVLTATKQGFRTINVTDLMLYIQDKVSRNFTLPVGAVSESLTVSAQGVNVNTTDAAVSTVVDSQFVENIPLNGRSLQSLITLAPGVLVVPSNGPGASGEFTVNGQRAESNYFTVDGVSANTGADNSGEGSGAGASGSLPGETALGSTQSLVSIDALQEFRATTSTYSAEYGRVPGGQFSFVTKSGTNEWHGSAFNYFRNEALDANNWFNNQPGERKPAERQNDFGGTLGGPMLLPWVYNGRNRTFFFFSYEGLRLQTPQAAVPTQVPDLALRGNAPVVLQPILDAFPVPNGQEVLDANNQPTGLAVFESTFSNPSTLDSISLRVDHTFNDRLKLFGRYGHTPSDSGARAIFSSLSVLGHTTSHVDTLTLGATSLLSTRLNNDFRFNYTENTQAGSVTLDGFGGSKPFSKTEVLGSTATLFPSNSYLAVVLGFGAFPSLNVGRNQSSQQQLNLTDSVNYVVRAHNLKWGFDYRRLANMFSPIRLEEALVFGDESQVLANNAELAIASSQSQVPIRPIYKNFSVFGQD